MNNSAAIPIGKDDNSKQNVTVSNPPKGGGESVKWIVIANTAGLLPAQVMVGRLQTVGIPAYAWQEGAGAAFGLTVGLLGAGHVAVPAEFAAEARTILEDIDEEE